MAICLRLATASHRRRLSGIFSRFEDGAPWDILLVSGEKMLGELLETDDPEGYVRDLLKGKEVVIDKAVLQDGTIEFDVDIAGLKQRFSFTED